jgi:hypothetical protein
MKLLIDQELIEILQSIREKGLTIKQWQEIESSDMFQSEHFTGGFDAIENAFCFSFFSEEKEYWFQVTLEQIDEILNKRVSFIQMTLSDE